MHSFPDQTTLPGTCGRGRSPTMMRSLLFRLFCLVAASTCSCLPWPLLLSVAEARLYPIVLVSDFHIDPHYGTDDAYGWSCNATTATAEWGAVGCDSPFALLASLVGDMEEHTSSEALLMFGGDWLRHDISQEESIAAFVKVADLMAGLAARHGSGVVPAPSFRQVMSLGNNDFIPDHYLDAGAKEQTQVRAYSEALLNASLLSPLEAQQFVDAGYYYRDVASPRLRVIVLNTLLYSPHLEPPVNPLNNPDPLGQFAFLSSRLEDAKRRDIPVVILSHIPPSMNSYYCVVDTCRVFMRDEFLTRYMAIIRQYTAVIVYQFYGHAHAMSPLSDARMGVPGMILPAVSPLFGNVPSYLLADYDDEGRAFGNFRMRSMDMGLGEWGPFTVNGVESIDALLGPLSTVDEVAKTAANLMHSPEAWGTYVVLHSGGHSGDMWSGATVSDATIKLRHVCTMLHFREADYGDCIARNGSPVEEGSRGISGGVIAVLVISFVIGVGGLLYAVFHYSAKGERRGHRVPVSTSLDGDQPYPTDVVGCGDAPAAGDGDGGRGGAGDGIEMVDVPHPQPSKVPRAGGLGTHHA